jgi:hemerythrin
MHHAFAFLVNRLQRLMKSRQYDGEINEILADIVCYAETHFAEEELCMRRAGYPGREEHASKHASFLKNIREIVSRRQRDESYYKELHVFLEEHFISHIKGEDMDFARWAKEHNVSGVL